MRDQAAIAQGVTTTTNSETGGDDGGDINQQWNGECNPA